MYNQKGAGSYIDVLTWLVNVGKPNTHEDRKPKADNTANNMISDKKGPQ